MDPKDRCAPKQGDSVQAGGAVEGILSGGLQGPPDHGFSGKANQQRLPWYSQVCETVEDGKILRHGLGEPESGVDDYVADTEPVKCLDFLMEVGDDVF